MKQKLTFADICGYLPHGLAMRWHDGSINTFYSIPNIEYGTPILRPQSDLYNTITHNGIKICPIVELAKICMPNMYNYEVVDNCLCRITCEKGSNDIYHFWWNRDFQIESQYSCKSFSSINQYQLFDYLHELKIDYRGLIDAGLAIDVNTLDVNPYK